MYGADIDKQNATRAIGSVGRELPGRADQIQSDRSTKRVPEIRVAANILNERAEVLHKSVAELEERLSVILRPQPPEAGPDKTGAPTYSCDTEVGQSMAQATNTIEAALHRVRMMLDLLEL